MQPTPPASSSADRRHRIPTAAYRLQLHSGFTFEDVRRRLQYFEQLGVSHLYFSPIFRAAPGSTHGYDVLDHSEINPELGGLAGLYELGEEMLQRGLGLIQDFVPNHVGLAGGVNPRWQDVMRYGPASRWASYFDIDWQAQPHMRTGVLVYPTLGKPFGEVLESGELRLVLNEDDFALQYYEHFFPLAPETYSDIAGLPPLGLRAELNDPAAVNDLIQAIETLRTAPPADAEPALEQFRRIVRAEPAVRRYLEERLEGINGAPGDSASFDQLDAILARQHYRLTYWRISGEEINYRRFFDINDLAGIRVEREDVFEETHRLLLELVVQGLVTGIRIDHVDGLYDPGAYLAHLRSRLREVSGREVPVYVEKILEAEERLPGWPVEGTTGYEFMARTDGLLIARAGSREMTQTYERFTGRSIRFRDVVYGAKRQITESAFAGEINVLSMQLHHIAQRHRRHRDNTLRSLRDAIEATLASFPVYRTYLEGDSPQPGDAEVIAEAVSEAHRREKGLPQDALRLLQEVLTLERQDLDPDELAQRAHFRRRFQQLSGPVMAKGLEDTAMYRYNRLVSLNEVGGDPSRFGIPPQEVHRWLQDRAETGPTALSAGSTHDTKRSEDARARIDVLSEVAHEWSVAVRSWARLNSRHRTVVGGDPAPGPNTEYLFYQNLIGSWPAGGPASEPEYVERMKGYLLKAVREMKAITSWTEPDEKYEAACMQFVEAVLDPTRSAAFIERVGAFVRSILPAAGVNSLGGVLLRLTAPGVPDIYQGSELWNLSLTDPDNRRPVDFDRREALLSGLDGAVPADLSCEEAKLWLIHRLLRLRSEHYELFLSGGYQPLRVRGSHAENLFAFARRHEQETLVVLIPRLITQIPGRERSVPLGDRWADTTVDLPRGTDAWRNALTGEEVEGQEGAPCRELLRKLPFTVLLSGERA